MRSHFRINIFKKSFNKLTGYWQLASGNWKYVTPVYLEIMDNRQDFYFF